MKVFRTMEIDPYQIQIGDKIDVYLMNLRTFKATAQRIQDDERYTYVTFMFDECITDRPMNDARTNLGGFDVSDMRKWLDETLIPLFPNDLKDIMTTVTLPSFGMIFGRDEPTAETYLESDDDERFVLMKKRVNRVADLFDCEDSYWLRNSGLQVIDKECFGIVNCEGQFTKSLASFPMGVRPVFEIMIDRR